MVRYSVTNGDTLRETFDKSCEKRKISRSDWISEACSTHLTEFQDQARLVHLPCCQPALWLVLTNMSGYDETYKNFRIDVPEYFNFRFDVIDAWANRDRNKLAMIWVNQDGVEEKFTFWNLMRLSNQEVNIMIKYRNVSGKGE